jgi:RNA polymerase sigma-70 factor (ECF subfamily)
VEAIIMANDQVISPVAGKSVPVPSTWAVERFTALFNKHYPRVVAFARRRTGNLSAAEDIAAEVFRITWERGELASTGWLFVTARNLLRNHYRAETRLAELHQRLRLERGVEPVGSIGESNAVLDAMDQLPTLQRELLLAHYWDQLSGAECAVLLDCSVGSVWVRLHRARTALRRILEKENES